MDELTTWPLLIPIEFQIEISVMYVGCFVKMLVGFFACKSNGNILYVHNVYLYGQYRRFCFVLLFECCICGRILNSLYYIVQTT